MQSYSNRHQEPGPDHTEPLPPAPTNCCLTPGCDKQVSTRGLCATCYQRARRAVTAGRMTWELLEANGDALPATRVRKVKPQIDAMPVHSLPEPTPVSEEKFQAEIDKANAKCGGIYDDGPASSIRDIIAAGPHDQHAAEKGQVPGVEPDLGWNVPPEERTSTNTFPGRGVGTMSNIETHCCDYDEVKEDIEIEEKEMELAEDGGDYPADVRMSSDKGQAMLEAANQKAAQEDLDKRGLGFGTAIPPKAKEDEDAGKILGRLALGNGKSYTLRRGEGDVIHGEGFTMRDLTGEEEETSDAIPVEQMEWLRCLTGEDLEQTERDLSRYAAANGVSRAKALDEMITTEQGKPATPERTERLKKRLEERTPERLTPELLERQDKALAEAEKVQRDIDSRNLASPADGDTDRRERLTWLMFLSGQTEETVNNAIWYYAKRSGVSYDSMLDSMIRSAEAANEDRNRKLKERLEAKADRDLEQYNLELRQKLQRDYADLKEENARLKSDNETLKIECNLTKMKPVIDRVKITDWLREEEPRNIPAEISEIFEKADLPELKKVVTFKGTPLTWDPELSSDPETDKRVLESTPNEGENPYFKMMEGPLDYELADGDGSFIRGRKPDGDVARGESAKDFFEYPEPKLTKEELEAKMRKALKETTFQPPLQESPKLEVSDDAKAQFEALAKMPPDAVEPGPLYDRIKEVGPEQAFAEQRLAEANKESERVMKQLKEMGIDNAGPNPVVTGPNAEGKMEFVPVNPAVIASTLQATNGQKAEARRQAEEAGLMGPTGIHQEQFNPDLMPAREDVIDGIDLGTNPRTEPEPMNIDHEVPYIVPKDGSYDALKRAEEEAGLSISVDGRAFSQEQARDRYNAWIERCGKAGLGVSLTVDDRKEAAHSIAHGIRPTLWPVIADEPVPYEVPANIEVDTPKPVDPATALPYEVPEIEEEPDATDTEIFRGQAHAMIGKAFGIMPYDNAVKKIVDQCYDVMAKTGRPEKKVLEECVTWARKQGANMNIRPKRNYAPNDPRSRPHPNSREDISFDPALDLPNHMRAVGDPLYVPPVIDD